MKAPSSFLISLIAAAVMFASCGEKAPRKKDNDDQRANFFNGTEPSLAVDSLENQLADSETEFLRSFAKDQIPWQKWDQKILEKATQSQLPIFVFVGSSLSPASLQVAREIDQNESLRRTISDDAICTVVDTLINPDIATLSFHLSNEINRSTTFPMAIWLSHEGSPLAWIPIGPVDSRELEKIITSASAMVNDIWKNSSRYSVENSRRDNEARQLRFKYPIPPNELTTDTSRDEIFQASTRRLSSFYSPTEQDLDNIGGLLPTSSLELLAVGSRSKLLTAEVRERCRTAARAVAGQLMISPLRDPLDHSYFYARRTNGWSLPSFSKNLESQAKLSSLFLNLGTLLDEPKFTHEGLSLLQQIEDEWLPKNIAAFSAHADKESPEAFLWSFSALKKILTKEEVKLASHAFSLAENGNLPIEADPLGLYFKLNSLWNKRTIPEIAQLSGEPATEIASKLEQVRQKMLDHRTKGGNLLIEYAITLNDLIVILKAQIDRSIQTGNDEDLEVCLETATRILKDYWNPETGLLRYLGKTTNTPAQGHDYAVSSLVMTLLYQRTLDPKWLSTAVALMDKALETFDNQSGLIAETSAGNPIIPVQQTNVAMIFGASTLGYADQTASRLFALTGKPAYKKLIDRHSELNAPAATASVVNHTDFVLSCALGDTPLIAVLHGPLDSPSAQEFLTILNAPQYLPFLSVRPAESTPPLGTLPTLPTTDAGNSVVLFFDDQILGKATSSSDLTTLLNSVISTRN